MKKITLYIASIIASIVLVSSTLEINGVSVGDKAPSFNLKNIDGKQVDLSKQKTEGAIVIFTCNHCPYSKAYEDRIIELNNRYKDSFPVIAINPNDSKKYPDDSYENMIKRAEDKGFTFPYLIDETQNIAKAYGALKTPHVYLLQKNENDFIVKYIGAIDNNTYEPENVSKKYLEEAILALKNNEKIKTPSTKAIGCSIKWK